MQLELSGRVGAQAYEPNHLSGRQYFTMEAPVLRGLKVDANPELALLANLGYAIVRKDKLSYVYDFS